MKYDNKMDLAIHIPEEEFLKWLKQFAPEVSEDATLTAVIPVPSSGLIIARVKTNKKHTVDYLKANARVKAS